LLLLREAVVSMSNFTETHLQESLLTWELIINYYRTGASTTDVEAMISLPAAQIEWINIQDLLRHPTIYIGSVSR
jgi:hypothetical protein